MPTHNPIKTQAPMPPHPLPFPYSCLPSRHQPQPRRQVVQVYTPSPGPKHWSTVTQRPVPCFCPCRFHVTSPSELLARVAAASLLSFPPHPLLLPLRCWPCDPRSQQVYLVPHSLSAWHWQSPILEWASQEADLQSVERGGRVMGSGC